MKAQIKEWSAVTNPQARAAAHHVNKHLPTLLHLMGIPEDMAPRILISFETDYDGAGRCFLNGDIEIYPHKLHRTFLTNARDPLLAVLLHELQHFRQIKQGRIYDEGDATVWEGKRYAHADLASTPYNDRPWEREANLIALSTLELV
jgi:hypothetical protein